MKMMMQGAALATKNEIVGERELRAKFDRISRGLLTREIMGRLTGHATTFIKDRTLEGKDKDNRDFEGYSEAYLDFKAKRGGKFFGGSVDLFNAGDMFSAMQPSVKGKTLAEIIFTRSSEALKASGHHNGSTKTGLPKREFFALGDKGRASVMELFEKHVEKLLVT